MQFTNLLTTHETQKNSKSIGKTNLASKTGIMLAN